MDFEGFLIKNQNKNIHIVTRTNIETDMGVFRRGHKYGYRCIQMKADGNDNDGGGGDVGGVVMTDAGEDGPVFPKCQEPGQ